MRERAKRIFERVRTRCHSELVSESPANLVGQQDFEHRKTILSAFIERFRMTKTSHSSFAKAIAFTLAETLVVMGIIGVVAALTIPNLNQSTGDREKVAKVKKVYANLTDAFGRAQAVYGPYDEWYDGVLTNSEDEITRFAERMTEFMKVAKVCKFTTGCLSTSPYYAYDGGDSWYKLLDNRDEDDSWLYNVILADGTSIAFEADRIHVDIDGPNKGPNKEGIDNFSFGVSNQDENGNPVEPYINIFAGNPGSLAGDFDYASPLAWIIRNGNMDYLKCPDELSWDGQTTCK